MNRYVALLLLVLGSLIVGCIHANEHTISLPNMTKASTVALVETVDGESHVYCGGVWVNEDEFVTARHCVAGAAIQRVLAKMSPRDRFIAMMTGIGLPDPSDEALVGLDITYTSEDDMAEVDEEPIRSFAGTVTALDKARDIAVVKVDHSAQPRHRVATIAWSIPATGEEVVIVGHTIGLHWTYMKGTVSGIRKRLFDTDDEDKKIGPFIQIVAPVFKGNSGGGAFDKNGRLIGIASFIVRAPNQSFFVHADTIHEFLKKNNVRHNYGR